MNPLLIFQPHEEELARVDECTSRHFFFCAFTNVSKYNILVHTDCLPTSSTSLPVVYPALIYLHDCGVPQIMCYTFLNRYCWLFMTLLLFTVDTKSLPSRYVCVHMPSFLWLPHWLDFLDDWIHGFGSFQKIPLYSRFKRVLRLLTHS